MLHHDEITQSLLGGNAIDRAVAYSTDVVGKECIGCMNALPYNKFRVDSSSRDGRRDLCLSCEAAPRLSTREHVSRLREANFSSEGVKRQRWANQVEYKDALARVGKAMRHADLLVVLNNLVPSLYVTDGRIEGDLAVFRTYPCPQPRLDGRDFEYLFYIPTGLLPEFSQYEFDEIRDIPIRESKRGWRTVLLRLIKAGLLNEDTVNRIFGRPDGLAASVWYRKLWEMRHQTSA